jgi:UrcA family protein
MQEMKTTIRGYEALVTGIAVVAAGLAVGDAQAHMNDYAPRTLAVNVQDLDLASARGQDVLRRRIKWAAEIVCGGPDARDLRMQTEFRTCVDSATNGALAQVESPQS